MTAAAFGSFDLNPREQTAGQFRVQTVARFAVNAHDLLLVRDDAGFDAGVPRGVRHQSAAADFLSGQQVFSTGGRRRHCQSRQKFPSGTPSAVRLRATLAAPPGMKLSRSNSTTGTGASGEMRDDAAPDELVEHHVAEDEHAGFRRGSQNLPRTRTGKNFCTHFNCLTTD